MELSEPNPVFKTWRKEGDILKKRWIAVFILFLGVALAIGYPQPAAAAEGEPAGDAIAQQNTVTAPVEQSAQDNPDPAPATEKPAPAAAADKPDPAPAQDNSDPALAREKSAPAPVQDNPDPAPAADKPDQDPAADKPDSAPAADKPAPETEKLEPVPVQGNPDPAPTVDKPDSAPAQDKPDSAPKPDPAPAQDKPDSAPAADKPNPAPAAEKPLPEPAQDKPDQAPAADKPGPAMAADKPDASPARNNPLTASVMNTSKKAVSAVGNIIKNAVVPKKAVKVISGIFNGRTAAKTPAGGSFKTGKFRPRSENNKAVTYRVRGGESLYLIGKTLDIRYEDIMAANGLADYVIYPYQQLVIPGIRLIDGGIKYIIKPRDTLYFIGRALGLDFADIMAANGLTGSLIFPGQELSIPKDDLITGEAGEDTGAVQSSTLKFEPVSVLADDMELLARVVFAEARGEDFEGQVAVAAVVLNRLRTTGFPKTIRDIIYQPRAFTSVDDGQINLAPDSAAYRAAQEALAGRDPSDGALYYWNPDIATSKWIWTRDVMKRIGSHLFGI